MFPKRLAWLWPCLITLLVSGSYIGIRLVASQMDPLALAEIGSRYANLDPAGEPGYDGQFSFYIARDLNPSEVEPFLDVPAYRYQRILYPLLARIFSFGNTTVLPWTLLGLNWIVHGLATLGVSWVLHKQGIRPGYALIYGLWVGLISSTGLDLHEPLAYALIVGAWVMKALRKDYLFALMLVIALFAKETTILFWAAALFPLWKDRSRNKAFLLLVGGGLCFVLWQFWLWQAFGSIGVGSGGDMASAFELIPLMGLVRIGFVDWRVFMLFLLIFGPTIVLPSLWGLWISIRGRLRTVGEWSRASLMLHALLILFLPFSTFREPLGLVRIATGLVLSILIVASEQRHTRVLNYSMFWIAMLAILIPQG